MARTARCGDCGRLVNTFVNDACYHCGGQLRGGAHV